MTDAPAETDGEVEPATSGNSATGEDDSTYSGLPSAFPYAFRSSESRLFRTYVVVGGLAALFVVLAFAAALVNLMGETAGAPGGTFTFSRAFFIVLMVLVFAPLVAPVLLAARHHRRVGPNRRYDRALAVGGYLFFLGMYVSLAVSVPPALQDESPGAVGAFLYSLPTPAAVVPPVVAVVGIYLAHRRYR
jgi:multisubunit Na+/H+ antiporter MnhG subunit